MKKTIKILAITIIISLSGISASSQFVNIINTDNEYNDMNDDLEFQEKNRIGSNIGRREGDVILHNNKAHLSQGLLFGIAFYHFYLGQSIEIYDEIQIGIEYKDTGILATGPSIHIFNFEKPGQTNEEDQFYDCVSNQIGKSDNFKWRWFTISNSEPYINPYYMGFIMIKIDSDGNDNTLIKNVTLKYKVKEEPKVEYDPEIGFMEFNPGSIYDIPPYSNYKITIIPNPNFAGQEITIPHNGVKITFFSSFGITEDAPTFPVIERWIFEQIFNPKKYFDKSIDFYDDQPYDDAGSFIFPCSKNINSNLAKFNDGSQSFDVSLKCIFEKYLNDDINGDVFLDSYFRSLDVGSIHIRIPNDHPIKPVIDGPDTVNPAQMVTFSAISSDPDEDKLEYGWDWDNDDIADEWTKSYNSNESCNIKKIWYTEGNHIIKVKVRDTHFSENKYESQWSNPFVVTVKQSKSANKYNILFGNLISRILNFIEI